MFASLDRIDIVLEGERYVQTDHRAAEEIEREPELSVIFALVRILNPKRMSKPGSPEQPVVLYSVVDRPPKFLEQAIRAAGGGLMIATDPRPILGESEPPPPLEDVIEQAFRNLARAVAVEFSVPLALEGLEVVERALEENVRNPDEDEVGYWSAVTKLGCFGGEVIRSSNGGRWVLTDAGSLPFALSTRFRAEEATVNPLGKAIKRFANGEEDSLVDLVKLIQASP